MTAPHQHRATIEGHGLFGGPEHCPPQRRAVGSAHSRALARANGLSYPSRRGPMQTVIRSQFLFIASCGALALGGVVSACSSNSNNGNSSTNTDSGAESDGASSSGGSLDSSSGSSSSGSSSSGASEAGATAEDGSEGGACTTINVMNF